MTPVPCHAARPPTCKAMPVWLEPAAKSPTCVRVPRIGHFEPLRQHNTRCFSAVTYLNMTLFDVEGGQIILTTTCWLCNQWPSTVRHTFLQRSRSKRWYKSNRRLHGRLADRSSLHIMIGPNCLQAVRNKTLIKQPYIIDIQIYIYILYTYIYRERVSETSFTVGVPNLQTVDPQTKNGVAFCLAHGRQILIWSADAKLPEYCRDISKFHYCSQLPVTNQVVQKTMIASSGSCEQM